VASSHRNRERRPGRGASRVEPKKVILVVCEGENTEPQYLQGLMKSCRNSRVDIEIAREHGVPKTLVEIAKRIKLANANEARRERDRNLAYDAVWCLFDVDEHPGIPDAKQMARDNEIDLAISNPCFELWLLLHFRDSPGMQSRAKIHRMLRSHVPAYDKHVDYSAYEPRYADAVKRAQRLDKLADRDGEPGRNPTTGVYKLTEQIRAE
jgi:RloB-like protein